MIEMVKRGQIVFHSLQSFSGAFDGSKLVENASLANLRRGQAEQERVEVKKSSTQMKSALRPSVYISMTNQAFCKEGTVGLKKFFILPHKPLSSVSSPVLSL
jgi:hypothetical protein